MSSEMLQELDFAQSALGQDLLAEDIGNLLDRDALIRLIVHCCAVMENAPHKSASSPDGLAN